MTGLVSIAIATVAASRRVLSRRGLLATLLGFWIGLSGSSTCAEAPTEYQVKAACLYHFAIFVEWPTQAFTAPSDPLVIGYLGDSTFGDALRGIIDRNPTAQNRRIEIRRYKSGEDPDGCHILFLPRSVAGRAETLLQRLDGRPVLTVGETDDFVRHGGMIGFALVEKSVRFDVNPETAQAAKLKISPRLLGLARSVSKSP